MLISGLFASRYPPLIPAPSGTGRIRISPVPELPLWEHALVSDPGGDLYTCHGAYKSAAFHRIQSVGFRPGTRDLSLWTTIIHFSGLNTGPAISLRPAPDLRYRFCLWTSLMSLLAELCSCGTSAVRLLRAAASSAKRLTLLPILLSARASPAKRCTAFAMCGHPLGNNIEFHLPFRSVPTNKDRSCEERTTIYPCSLCRPDEDRFFKIKDLTPFGLTSTAKGVREKAA